MTRYTYTLAQDDAAPLGLVVLQTDETIERDMRRLLGDRAPYVSRVQSGLNVTPETLQAMAGHVTQSAALLPAALRYGAIGYGCTSATAQIGAGRIAELVGAGADTGAVTDPLSALLAACRALKVKKLAFLSPYVADVSARLRDTLNQNGIETPIFGSFDEDEEAKVVRIDAPSIEAAAVDLCQGQSVDAVFLSCTNLRTLDVIAPLEAILGIPVLSSNLVLAWHMAQLGQAQIIGPGQLIAAHPAG
ncbi:Asp/Glu racemase [Ascidiaceihabitans sp.]|uniref:maleate cis-trans isomerase family protein n=1 Tax=Ascidiaceihabitans sp. TaxID=1872644 RepID=UPI00329A3A58